MCRYVNQHRIRSFQNLEVAPHAVVWFGGLVFPIDRASSVSTLLD